MGLFNKNNEAKNAPVVEAKAEAVEVKENRIEKARSHHAGRDSRKRPKRGDRETEEGRPFTRHPQDRGLHTCKDKRLPDDSPCTESLERKDYSYNSPEEKAERIGDGNHLHVHPLHQAIDLDDSRCVENQDYEHSPGETYEPVIALKQIGDERSGKV